MLSRRIAMLLVLSAAAFAATAQPPAAPEQTPTPISGNKLTSSTTVLKISDTATTDAAYLTPLPEEYRHKAAHLPKGFSLKLPFEGTFRISNGYGFESQGWTHQTIGNTHSANDYFALDISMPEGTAILAPADGRIVTSQDRTSSDSYGLYMVIDHGQNIHTVYAHLSKLEHLVDHGKPMVFIKQGELVGHSGKTGTRWPHLHFAVHLSSRLSHSGADVDGIAVVPEPISGYYGIRKGHELTSDNKWVKK